MKSIILTAKCGLGTYIPAVYTYRYLQYMKVEVELLVYEDFYPSNNEEKIRLYQKNPRIAEFAYAFDKIFPAKSTNQIVKHILDDFYIAEELTYICFSGVWTDELLRVQKVRRNKIINVIMDAFHSILWERQLENPITNTHSIYALGQDIYIFKKCLDITSFEYRNDILIQGGGWNLIDYKQIDYVKSIINGNIKIALTVDNPSFTGNKIIYNIIEKYDFPRNNIDKTCFNTCYHPLLDEYNSSKCCISKPGGMTIVDSIMTCTPLLIGNTTIGRHEYANKEFCKKLGIAHDLFSFEVSKAKYLLKDLYNKQVELQFHSKDLREAIYNLL